MEHNELVIVEEVRLANDVQLALVVLSPLFAVEEVAEVLQPKVPLSNARLSYVLAPPGANGFKPPKPKGEYNKLGLGKKNGRELGKLDDDETGVFEDVSGFLSFVCCLDVLAPTFVTEVVLSVIACELGSIPDNPGKPNPAKFAKSELVKLTLLKPLIPLRTLIFGIPPNGIKSGFFGSNPPRERPESKDVGLIPPSDGKGKFEGVLTGGFAPGGLDNNGGLPGPFFLSPGGRRF